MTSLAVMGAGRIGGEVAFLATILGLADEITLYDINRPLLEAQILELSHTGLDVRLSTDPAAIASADIAVFAAGSPRNPGIRTRADLLGVNLPVADHCCRLLQGFSGVLVTITNPMDANNYYLCTATGLPRERCIGFGGQLDSARFATFLKERGREGPAWVLGEHGEHQVPLFSRLDADVPVEERDAILARMRGSSMPVIQGKGGTVFGPAWHISTLLKCITLNERRVLPVSCVLDGEYGVKGCSLGVPARIGRNGIEEIYEWTLDDWEEARFRDAAESSCVLCRRSDA